MFKLSKFRKKTLETRGFLLIVTYDIKERTTSYFVYNPERNTFDKKKLILNGNIGKNYFVDSMDTVINMVSGKKEFKRFLAGSNVIGIYYEEDKIVEDKPSNYSISSGVYKLFYVPSRMQLAWEPDSKVTSS